MDAILFNYNCKWESALSQHAGVQRPDPRYRTRLLICQMKLCRYLNWTIADCICHGNTELDSKSVFLFTLFFFLIIVFYEENLELHSDFLSLHQLPSGQFRAPTQNKTQEHICSAGSASKIRKNSDLESCTPHVIHTLKNKHTKLHLQDVCKSTWTSQQQIMMCSQSFWLQLSIIPKCIHAQVPSERLTAGLGTILLPTN